MAVWACEAPPTGDQLHTLDLPGEVRAQIQETLSGIRVVKSSSAEEIERERFRSVKRSSQDVLESGTVTGTRGSHRRLADGWHRRHPVAGLVLSDGALSGAQFVSFGQSQALQARELRG